MFTKKDLKTGYIVIVKSGNGLEPGMVLLGTNNGDIVSGKTWFPLNQYTDQDLFGESYKELRIHKVYVPRSNMSHNLARFSEFDSGNYMLLWERKVETEQQKKIRELEETINQAKAQIEALKKEV